jgi:hypothetical protein
LKSGTVFPFALFSITVFAMWCRVFFLFLAQA